MKRSEGSQLFSNLNWNIQEIAGYFISYYDVTTIEYEKIDFSQEKQLIGIGVL